jgi:hypothetical protein
MPRYFFHLLDENTDDLMRDSVGCTFSDTSHARSEAIALARDIASHGLQGRRWQVIATDGDAVVLTVSHNDIHPRRIKSWLDLGHRVAAYEARLRPHIFAWLLTALVLAVIAQAATTFLHRDEAASHRAAGIEGRARR